MTDREEGVVHDIIQEAGKNLEAMMAVKSIASSAESSKVSGR